MSEFALRQLEQRVEMLEQRLGSLNKRCDGLTETCDSAANDHKKLAKEVSSYGRLAAKTADRLYERERVPGS